ncbi:MAG: hypothetical protein U0R80_01300 [Nocardioidaceae bacterium]
MTTLHDLRAELDAHAGDVVDTGAAPRTIAVHERVRVIRRRRRSVATTAAVLALVAGGAGVTVLTQDRDHASVADRTLVGQVAPEHLTSLGFGYTFVTAAEGEGEARLSLDASDEPRLVTWAGAGDGAVTVTTGADETTSTSDFGDFLPVYEGADWQVTVTGEGRVAVAVYDLSELADGVTQDGVVFRRDVAGDQLLDAAFGDGNEPVSFTVPMPEGALRVTEVCRGAPKGAELEIEVAGIGRMWTECKNGWSVDAGLGGGTLGKLGMPEPGTPVTIRTRLTQGHDGPVITPDGVDFGVGAYAVDTPAAAGWGSGVSRLVEADGHLWRFVSLTDGRPEGGSFTATSPTEGPRWVELHFSRVQQDAIVRGLIQGQESSPYFGGGGTGSAGLGLAEPGSRVTIRVQGDPGSRARVALAFYERVD